jgi:hypothetical protein
VRYDEEETVEEVAGNDPRYDRRKFPGWRKVRLGLLLLLIAQSVPLVGLLCGLVALRFPGMGQLLSGLLLMALQILLSVGAVFCTFVPLSGWSRKLAITNLGLAVALAAGQAVAMLSRAHSSDPRKFEADVAKIVQESGAGVEKFQREMAKLEADHKARREKIRTGPKDRNTQDTQKQLSDLNKEYLEGLERLTKTMRDENSKSGMRVVKEVSSQMNRKFMFLQLGLMLHSLFSCLQVVILAWFLRGVASFFKADDLKNSCLVLILAALVCVVPQLLLGSVTMFQIWRPGQSGPRFLNPTSVVCLLLPFTLTWWLLLTRLLVRVRGMLADFLP